MDQRSRSVWEDCDIDGDAVGESTRPDIVVLGVFVRRSKDLNEQLQQLLCGVVVLDFFSSKCRLSGYPMCRPWTRASPEPLFAQGSPIGINHLQLAGLGTKLV